MIKIVADSTCDLGPELIAKYDIQILPLHVILGDREFLDGLTITPEEIYKWSDEHKTTPKTSAVSLDTTMDLFKSIVDAGDEIIAFSISDDMSTTGNVMRLAAEELGASDKISVINSMSLSTGIGLQVLYAAELVQKGMERSRVVSYIESEIRPYVSASFVVDQLTYLHRGGRCSSVAALAGSVLKLHPEINVVNGKMGAGKKFRGNYSRILMDYAKEQETKLLNARKGRVFITTSGQCDAEIEAVKAYLESLHYFDEILVTRAGSVISSHCGPKTLGVLYIQGRIDRMLQA